MRSNCVSYALLLWCFIASSSMGAIVKREAPLSSGSHQSQPPSSSGGFGGGNIGGGSLGGAGFGGNGLGSGGFDASIFSSSGSYGASSESANLGSSELSGRFGSSEFGRGSSGTTSNYLPPSTSYGIPVTTTRPTPPPSTGYGVPSHPPTRPSHQYGTSPPSDRPHHGAHSRPSQGYGSPTPLPPVTSRPTSSYGAPPASAGSGDYIGNSGRYPCGDSS